MQTKQESSNTGDPSTGDAWKRWREGLITGERRALKGGGAQNQLAFQYRLGRSNRKRRERRMGTNIY